MQRIILQSPEFFWSHCKWQALNDVYSSSSFFLGCGAPLAASCPPGKWECPALPGVCIDLEKICDDKLDCPNGADEGPGCDNIECDRYGLSSSSVFASIGTVQLVGGNIWVPGYSSPLVFFFILMNLIFLYFDEVCIVFENENKQDFIEMIRYGSKMNSFEIWFWNIAFSWPFTFVRVLSFYSCLRFRAKSPFYISPFLPYI